MIAPTNSSRLLGSRTLAGLGVPHGFTTRLGGVSSGMFASLNFGNPGELAPEHRDPIANIRANLALVMSDLGVSRRRLKEVWQVHGCAAHVVRAGDSDTRRPSTPDPRADAVVTDDPDVMVGVRVADCAPVLLSSADGRVVAAVHAGWRGVIAGVVDHALVEMRALGAQRVVGAIGACIGADAFEVGEEVADEFCRVFGDAPEIVRQTASPGQRPRVDLKAALRTQLVRAGVASQDIDVLTGCSVRDERLFFSHRRERGQTGRMLALIGPRSA